MEVSDNRGEDKMACEKIFPSVLKLKKKLKIVKNVVKISKKVGWSSGKMLQING